VHINRSVFWGSIALAALTFISCSRVGQRPKSSYTSRLSAAGGAAPRKVYRYSVVPGGVYSTEELAAARRTDPVVNAHYAGFGDGATVRRLSADMLVYVSYRKANRVYWTTKKHRVCKGESIITDGKNMARTRCGNRLSVSPQQPTLGAHEPGPKAFDTTEEPLLAALPDGPLFLPNEGLPPLTLPETHSGATPDIGPVAPSPSGAHADNLAPTNYIPELFPILPAGPLFAPFPGVGGTGVTGGTGSTTATPAIPITPTVPITPVVPASIPEPGSWSLLLVGYGSLTLPALLRRVRRK
jgi:hypothetical protein